MKKKTKKLVLAKETLQNLDLQNASGFSGYGCTSAYCPSGDFWNPCPEH